MEYRLPYYMAYPMPLQYDDERMERRDYEYLKSMYPSMAKQILPYVEDECEKMEYEGSMMFDEYPDQLQLRLMCGRIYERVKSIEHMEDAPEEQMEMQQFDRRRKDDWLRDLIEVMLFQELYKRRCDNRRCRRRYF